MMNEPEAAAPLAPSPEPMLSPLPEPTMRRFFRDIDSAGNLEDGMEFHAAGIVIDMPPEGGDPGPKATVLYLNPFNAQVERRGRLLDSVVLYEFPRDDGVYWRLWEQTRITLERLEVSQGSVETARITREPLD